MHIRSLRQALVENLIDLISIKSGLMISESKAFDFLSEILPGWWQGDKKEIIRIEVGEFEDAFIHLMYKVGAIQNKEDLTDVVISYVKNNYQQLCLDPTNVMEVYKTVNDLKIHLLENTLQNKTFPEKFLQLPHLEILIRDFKDRYIMHNEMPDSVNWNGIIPLNTLFEEEIIPDGSSSNCYFDQRYIDYLNRQIEDIGKIHWRQFEYLTGEFFQRNGYVVEVTSGRGDEAANLKINSTKSMIGHLLGAAGAVEFITCVKEIQDGFIHKTVGYETPDEEIDLNYCKDSYEEPVEYALSNSLGFGGHNASILLKAYK
jgi:hypothetical protein